MEVLPQSVLPLKVDETGQLLSGRPLNNAIFLPTRAGNTQIPTKASAPLIGQRATSLRAYAISRQKSEVWCKLKLITEKYVI